MSIECGGGCGPLGGHGWLIYWAQRETPKSSSALFAPTFEEDGVIFGEYGHTFFFEEDSVTVVAELANSDGIMLESGYDLGIADW